MEDGDSGCHPSRFVNVLELSHRLLIPSRLVDGLGGALMLWWLGVCWFRFDSHVDEGEEQDIVLQSGYNDAVGVSTVNAAVLVESSTCTRSSRAFVRLHVVCEYVVAVDVVAVVVIVGLKSSGLVMDRGGW